MKELYEAIGRILLEERGITKQAIEKAIADIELKQGPAGEKGEQGESGPQGEKGEAGRDGVDGAAGKDGINGKDGKDAEPLDYDTLIKLLNKDKAFIKSATPTVKEVDVALALMQMPDFKEMIKPINGIDGQDGKDGIDGRDGKDGVNGKDGKDGVNGKDGKDADESEILQKVYDQIFRAITKSLPELINRAVEKAVAALPKPKDGENGKDAEPAIDATAEIYIKGNVYRKDVVVQHYQGQLFRAKCDTASEPPHADWERIGTGGIRHCGGVGKDYQPLIGDIYVKNKCTFFCDQTGKSWMMAAAGVSKSELHDVKNELEKHHDHGLAKMQSQIRQLEGRLEAANELLNDSMNAVMDLLSKNEQLANQLNELSAVDEHAIAGIKQFAGPYHSSKKYRAGTVVSDVYGLYLAKRENKDSLSNRDSWELLIATQSKKSININQSDED